MNFNDKIKYLVSKDVVSEKKCLCSDKLKVKTYIQDLSLVNLKIPKTIEVLGKKIEFNKEKFQGYKYPFVIKCNHGCKYNSILEKYDECDIRNKINFINNCVKKNFSTLHNEYQYAKIDPLIYIEEYIPVNFLCKFHCFHGKPMFIEIFELKNFDKTLFCNEYDINYNPFEFTNCKKQYDKTPKIDNLEMIIKYTEKISREFDYVRVDYYIDRSDSIWFNELTFSPSAGKLRFINNMNEYFGSLI